MLIPKPRPLSGTLGVPEESFWARLLDSLLPASPIEAVQQMGQPLTTWVSKPVVQRLLAKAAAEEGRLLGKGSDFAAWLLSDPEVGRVVVKKLGQPEWARMGLAGSEATLAEALRAADRFSSFVPPTQAASRERMIYLLQPYVEPSAVPAGFGRLVRGIGKILRRGGAEAAFDIDYPGNVLWGTLHGRTRPWVVDIGAIIPKAKR